MTTLIDQLKRKTYKPVEGKTIPGGIRAGRDTIRAILDPFMSMSFHPHSYGFRKGRALMDARRSPHGQQQRETLLRDLKSKATSIPSIFRR